jgi:hypothetical protein
MARTRSLTPLEREALMIRHQAAMRLVRADPDLSPEEALLMVIAPSAAIRQVSLDEALRRRAVARERGCSCCGGALDADGFCSIDGHLEIEAAVF